MTTVHESSVIGRRERHRLHRRRAILLAGLRLFAERGYVHTTIADIADAADVALRTVSLYFPTKLDIALGAVDDILVDLAPALVDRPPEKAVLDIIENWLRGLMGHRDMEAIALLIQVFERDPEIRALTRSRVDPLVARGMTIPTSDLDDPNQQFVAQLVYATLTTVVGQLIESPPTVDAEEAVSTAMAFLRAGIASLPASASSVTNTLILAGSARAE